METIDVKSTQQITLIYIGRRWHKNKIAHAYMEEIDYLAGEDCYIIFKSKLSTFNTIGAKVLVERTTTGVKPTKKNGELDYHYVGSLEDKETLAVWFAEDKATYDKKMALALEKKVCDTSYDDAVAQLKYIYMRLSNSQKTSFIVRLIKDIQL